MKVFQEMAEEWWFELNVTWCLTVTGFQLEGLREKFSLGPGFEPGSPAHKAGDPGSNPGPGENFF